MNARTLLSLVALAASGCATVQLPQQSLASSAASIRGAEELGAENVPEAKLHLQLARDQTEAARKLAANGNERAPLVLARAQADADLALTLAREATVRKAAAKASEDLKELEARRGQ